MDDVLAVLEGTCPDCGSDQLAVTVTCHPNEAGNWSEGVTVVARADPTAYRGRSARRWGGARRR